MGTTMINLGRPVETSEVADRFSIHDCLARQAMGNDTLDAELWKSAFWPDATEDHGWYDGNAHAFVNETIPMLIEQMEMTWHQVGLPLITISGDIARSVACFYAYCRTKSADEKPKDLLSGGRYIDVVEKRDGIWRIARRVTKGDWVRIEPASYEWGAASINGFIPRMGTRNADDPARILFGRIMGR